MKPFSKSNFLTVVNHLYHQNVSTFGTQAIKLLGTALKQLNGSPEPGGGWFWFNGLKKLVLLINFASFSVRVCLCVCVFFYSAFKIFLKKAYLIGENTLWFLCISHSTHVLQVTSRAQRLSLKPGVLLSQMIPEKTLESSCSSTGKYAWQMHDNQCYKTTFVKKVHLFCCGLALVFVIQIQITLVIGISSPPPLIQGLCFLALKSTENWHFLAHFVQATPKTKFIQYSFNSSVPTVCFNPFSR